MKSAITGLVRLSITVSSPGGSPIRLRIYQYRGGSRHAWLIWMTWRWYRDSLLVRPAFPRRMVQLDLFVRPLPAAGNPLTNLDNIRLHYRTYHRGPTD